MKSSKKKIIKKDISKKKAIKNEMEPEKKEMKKPILKKHIARKKSDKEEKIEPLKVDKTKKEEDIIGRPEEKVEDIKKTPVNITKDKKTQDNSLKKEEDYKEEKNNVEALLFAHGKYIDESLISELCGIDKRRIRRILEQLKDDYEKKDSALAIFQEGNSWKINVREKHLSIVRKIVADTELPKSVMETLAVIAWKSPIYQSEVVRIRGNKCYDHIEVLEESGFVTKDKKGRSYVLKTTDKFYNYFEIDHGNLKSIFEEVKVPVKEEQKTLGEDIKIPENIDIEKKIEHIEVKKWTETDEEKEQQRQFLEMMEGKIRGVQQITAMFEEEIPSPKREVAVIEQTITQIPDGEDTSPEQENNEENSPAEQQPEQEVHKKPKSLTKKQLEKKFKDDIIRVREKMEKK